MTRSSLLTVSDLRIAVRSGGAGSVEAVLGTSFHAERGEVVGLVGESGSGKSLTLRGIAGLLPANVHYAGGSVDVDGMRVETATPAQLRQLHGALIGMVFQEPMTALNPTMRVGVQIAEAARSHKEISRADAKQRAIELLERMGFAEPERRYRLFPHELSGGMRQRVMIAVALAGDPALLLCDEPTTALDATVTMRVLDLLVELASDLDIGIVFVTHDLGVAARLCDRIVVMYAGRVLEEGPADAVLRRPRHPYTLALLRAVPTRTGKLEDLRAIPGSPPGLDEQIQGCPFAPRCEFVEPECLEPIALTPVSEGRLSACVRHQLLAEMAREADG